MPKLLSAFIPTSFCLDKDKLTPNKVSVPSHCRFKPALYPHFLFNFHCVVLKLFRVGSESIEFELFKNFSQPEQLLPILK